MDCAETIKLAPEFLPETPLMFGRASKPRSHWLYRSDLCEQIEQGVQLYPDPDPPKDIKGMLVELRFGGGDKGAQTVFPGSTHEEGEPIEWESEGEPAEVGGALLQRQVARLAAAALIVRHWSDGSRHFLGFTLGGFLCRAGWSEDEAAHFVEVVAKASGDREWEDRVQAARDQFEHHQETGQGLGLPKLIEMVGEKVAAAIAKWLCYHEVSKGGIELIDGRLPQAVDQAEAALLAKGNPFGIYQFAGQLVRPVHETVDATDNRKTKTYQLSPLTVPYLCDKLGRATTFWRFDGRRNALVRKDCPRQIAETLLSRAGEWRAPILNGVTSAPLMRRDGSICETPGYDETSAVLYMPGGEMFPHVPVEPTKEDAMRALNLLWGPLKEFPFVDASDAGVALSGILTLLDRRSLDSAPLHAFTAPVAGSGKSLLVDVASVIATGFPAAVLATGKTPEELQKRIDAALIAGQPIVTFDNLEYPLESEALGQALSQPWYSARVLGLSKNVNVKVGTTFFTTGNNLTIVGDLTRRSLVGQIDPRCERPELRSFEGCLTDLLQFESARD